MHTCCPRGKGSARVAQRVWQPAGRTLWPFAPRARAMAFPIPLDDPVTTATFGSDPAGVSATSGFACRHCTVNATDGWAMQRGMALCALRQVWLKLTSPRCTWAMQQAWRDGTRAEVRETFTLADGGSPPAGAASALMAARRQGALLRDRWSDGTSLYRSCGRAAGRTALQDARRPAHRRCWVGARSTAAS